MQTAVVGYVLTQGELAVGIDLGVVANLDFIEPVNQHLCVLLETGGILGLPPVVQVAVLVVVAALVVETVGHLMTNHHSDGTIVESIVGIHVEEGFLQDACGETNLVGSGVVVGVDRLRSHAPFGLVHRFVNLRHHIGDVELVAADNISEVAVVLDFQATIVAPLVGIAHLHHNGGQFLDSALFGTLAHPLCIVNAHGESLFQIVHHLNHAVFGGSGEVTLHIELTQSLAHCTVNRVGYTFPAGTNLLGTAESAAVELEVGIHEIAAQVACSRVDYIPSIVCLDGFQTLGLVQSLAHLLEILGLAHVETGELGQTDFGEIGLIVDAGGLDIGRIQGHLIVGLEGVAVGLIVILGFGQTGFKIHHHLGQLGRSLAAHLVVAGIGKLGLHQLDVSLAQLGLAAFALKIVVALAHPDTGLIEPCNAHIGIGSVGLVEHGKERIDANAMQTAHLGLRLGGGLQCGNLFQIGLDRFNTLLLDSGGVHTHLIEGGNLVAIAAGGVLRVDKRVDESTQLLLVGLGQHVESAIAAVFGIQRVGLKPTAACIVIEILGRVECSVEVVQIDTRAQLGTFVARCRCKE